MSKWGHLGILMCLILSTQAWASVGKVSLLKGEATASRNDQTIALANGVALEEKDLITTHANSQLQLTFEDKTVITLGSESVFKIEEYLNDANDPKAKFKFNQGTFKTITGQIGKKAPENFNLETKTATIGIRGTTIGGNVSSGSIFCLSGTITVAPLSMPAMVNVVPTGYVIHVRTPNTPPPPPAQFTPADLQQLNQNLGANPSSQAGGSSQSGGSTSTPPPAPTIAEQATQSSQQTNTYTNFSNQVDTYSDSFYPIFKPTLQSSSNHQGTLSLSGLVTSQHISDGIVMNTLEDLTLSLNTNTNSISNGTILLDYEGLDNDPLSLSLVKESNSAKMTYKNLNEFAIKDFNAYQGWIQTENTYANDYVSWGYWAIKANDDTKLLPTKNYWVAGKDSDAAIAHIATLPANTHYIYTGKVLGSVEEGGVSYNIATDTSSVQLKFDFGGGTNTLFSGANYSWIRFTANGKDWDLAPTLNTPTITDGKFSDSLTGTVLSTPITSGAIQGKFYGNQAQAVGGTFNATTGTSTAVGVYKAVR